MKRLITVMACLFVISNAVPVYAECENEPAWLKNFPANWTLKWEYKTGELTVREYRSPDNWLGIYYRTDYPARIVEALLTEAPGTDDPTGRFTFIPGEMHHLIRLVKPKNYIGECWREVYDFRVEIRANTLKRDVWYSIIEIENKNE